MSNEDIKKGSLVIVVDRENTPPRICWGLVHTQFPSGDNYDVQTGDSPNQKNIFHEDKLIFVMQTDGKFTNPTEAVEANKTEILLLVSLIALTSKEFAELKRYKAMTEKKLKGRLKRGFARLFHRV